MKSTKILIFVSILIISLQSLVVVGQQVTMSSLLKELTDRDEKARFPLPEYTCRQASSYDRTSVSKDDKTWFANWDRTQFIGIERQNGRREFVMMDVSEPGAIVRFWMTFAGANCGLGTLRIYVDDMTTPVIEGKAFDVLSGTVVAAEPLASSVSKLTQREHRGHNLYFPIPYSKHCKVTYESENIDESDIGAHKNTECVYYNINYRTYAPEVNVEPYSTDAVKRNKTLINTVQNQLLAQNTPAGKSHKTLNLDADLKSGESKSFTINGPNAIRSLGMQLEAANKEQALRSIVMEIRFDGSRTVWSPVGDLFGVGYHQIYTHTWATTANKDGAMNAFWTMPFKSNCVITLHNYGSENIKIHNATAKYSAWKWDDRSMHFGVSWHQYNSIPTGSLKCMEWGVKSVVDMNFVELKGKGVYVGDGIALFNTTFDWWGEGDEKIYVDGEQFPSHFGTGTEDYYGYAWCRPEVFTDHPFIAQPCGDGSFAPAYSTNTRIRALDAIPFNNSLVFDMELWHWGNGNINYAPTTFWYVIPGGQSTIAPDMAGVQAKVATKRTDLMSPKLNITIEAENMVTVKEEGGYVRYQYDKLGVWSKDLQLHWRDAVKGSKLTMSFVSDLTMVCNTQAMLTLAPDAATINIYLNGKQIGSNIDLSSPKLKVKGYELTKGTLLEGENIIIFEIAGIKNGAEKVAIGIDQLIFSK